MSSVELPRWYQGNRYNAASACKECGGVVRHSYWCPESNPSVAYAYGIVREPQKISVADQLILHALGVCWSSRSS